MTIKRSNTWLTKELPNYLLAHHSTPFVWGENDCCLFAANAIQAYTGVDIADDFRGKYDSQESAFATIKTITGGSTVTDALAYVAAKHGLTEWTRSDGSPLPLMAKRGDLVAVNNGGNIIAGVVDTSGRYVAAMGDGIVSLPLSSIARAWHVPA